MAKNCLDCAKTVRSFQRLWILILFGISFVFAYLGAFTIHGPVTKIVCSIDAMICGYLAGRLHGLALSDWTESLNRLTKGERTE